MKCKAILDKETLENLYINKNKTTYEIAEMLQTTRKTVVKYLKQYNIPIIRTMRKFNLLKQVPLTQEQKNFVVGTVLGDGCLVRRKSNHNTYLSIGHCEEQKELTYWKKDIMGNLVNVVRKQVDKRGNSVMYNFTSMSHIELNFYHTLFYQDDIKLIKDELINHLTPFGLAVWIMDDGSLNKEVNLRLHTEGFSMKDQEKLQYMLKFKFDLKSKIAGFIRNEKEYHFLSFNKENTFKMNQITKDYFIDSMKYKQPTFHYIIEEQKIFDNTDSSTTTC